jgi:hypothetical protein
MRRPSRSASGTVAAVALVCVLGSCGTNPTPSQTSAPPTTAASSTAGEPTAAACEDIAALKSSLEALTKVRPGQDGVGALRTAIANVKSNLDTAEASASPVLKPSVEQVKTAFDAL